MANRRDFLKKGAMAAAAAPLVAAGCRPEAEHGGDRWGIEADPSVRSRLLVEPGKGRALPITGTFLDEISHDIPHQNWGEREWDRDFRYMKAIGIDSTLTVEEDPDATYIKTGDFDLALYCMIADKSGDPYYFIDSTLRNGSYYDCGGFDNDQCEALINQLEHETDVAKRAELANQIIQIAIDDNAFGYVGLFNKITCLKPGITGYANNNPFDFYAISADTDITA